MHVELYYCHLQAVVVGYFNFAGIAGSPGYYSFYTAALRFLEKDPQREIGFAVVTDKETGGQMGIDFTPALRIYMWNETLVCSHLLHKIKVKFLSESNTFDKQWC
jgi:hypothetical protein